MANGVEAFLKVKEGHVYGAIQAAGQGRDAGQNHDLAVGASLGHEAGLALTDDVAVVDEPSEFAVNCRVEHAGQDA